MTLTDVERDILAEGEKLANLAKKGALEVRRLNLLAVVEDIDAELKKLMNVVKTKAPAKAEAKPAAAKAPDTPVAKDPSKE